MPKNQDKIEKLQTFEADPNLAIFKEIQDVAEAISNFKNVEMVKVKGNKGDKGDKGEVGKTGKEGKQGTQGKEGKKGKDGSNGSNGIDGEQGEQGEKGDKGDIKDLAPDEIRNALEILQEDERLDQSSIKGLDELKKELKEEIQAVRGMKASIGIGGLVNTVRYEDLTSQCDGANKTFQVPLHRKAIMLTGTQFPLIYRPVTDYITANHTLTLTSEVAAPDAGQTLIFQFIK